MLWRGGGSGAGSGAFEAGVVPGGGAATGPAGACALAVCEHNSVPASPRNEKTSRCFVFKGVFKSSSASLPKKAEVGKCHLLESLADQKDAFARPVHYSSSSSVFGSWTRLHCVPDRTDCIDHRVSPFPRNHVRAVRHDDLLAARGAAPARAAHTSKRTIPIKTRFTNRHRRLFFCGACMPGILPLAMRPPRPGRKAIALSSYYGNWAPSVPT